MPVRLVFRCQFCDARPDPDTQHTLERHGRAMLFGEYLDAPPEGWLVWTGRGIYGPERYACPAHRRKLKAFLRRHYGTIGWHPFAPGPHTRFPRPATPRQRALMRNLGSGGWAGRLNAGGTSPER